MLSELKGKNERYVIVGAIVLLNVWHFIALDYYDFSKDEYYKMALAKRWEFGYLGTMPFSVWLIGIVNNLFGESLVVVRLIPAILSLITSYFIVLIIDQLKGGTTTKLLALVSFLNAPVIMGTFHMYSQNSIDLLFWALSVLLLLKYLDTQNTKFWYLLMICLGLGLTNRLTILWFGFTLFLFILFFRRGWFSSLHFWFGALIPLVVISPILYWQFVHDFAHFNYVIDSSSAHIPVWEFWLNQLLIHNPLNALVWTAGFVYLFRNLLNKDSTQALGIIALGSLIIVTWMGREKPYNFYYSTPIYIILYPIGAIAFEKIIANRIRYQKVLIVVLTISSILTSIALFTPLSINTYQHLTQLTILKQVVEGFDIQANIPPQISNQYGWRNFNQTFNETREILADRGLTDYVIWPNHYSMASAIEVLNPDLKIPVISHSESYWIFGLADSKDQYLVICNYENDMLRLFENTEVINVYKCQECPVWRNEIHFILAKNPQGLEEYWSTALKN